MKYKYLLTVLFVQLHHLFEVYPLQLLLHKKVLAKKFDLTKYIEQECLQIVLDEKQQSDLSLQIAPDTTVHIRSHMSLKFRDISTEQEGHCENFLIFAKSIEMVNQILRFNQSFVKQFFPFTNIYFHLENRQNYTINVAAIFSVRQFLINNALFGYVFEYNDNDNESNVVLKDLLWNDAKLKRASHIPYELKHPMVDTNLVKNDFHISLFNCTPYTIYPQQENEDDKLVTSTFF